MRAEGSGPGASSAFLVGFGVGGLPGAALAAGIAAVNPWFVDDPLSAWAWLCAVPGVLVGLAARRRAGKGGWIAVLPLLVVLAAARAPDGPIPELRLVIVGIDGASWDAATGPALSDLRSKGVSGRMRASPPLFSPVLWTTLFTGRTQAEHGVRGFEVHAADLRVPTVFDVAEHAGHRLGLMGWLVGWPPRKLVHGGFSVPGWLAPSPETEPADLQFLKEIELGSRLHRAGRPVSWPSAVGRGIARGFRFSTLRDAAWALRPGLEAREVDRQLVRARLQRDVAVAELWRTRPSVALYVYYPTDAIGHRFWGREGPWSPLARAWRDADAITGEIAALLPADGRIVVVSDHGFRGVDPAGDGVLVSPKTAPIAALVEPIAGPAEVWRVGAKVAVAVPGRAEAVGEALSALTLDGRPMYRVSVPPGDEGSVILDLVDNHVPADRWDDRVAGRPLSDWLEPNTAFTGDHAEDGLFLAAGAGIAPGHADVQALDVAPVLLSLLGLHRGDLPGRVPPGLPDAGPGPSWDFVRDELVFPHLDGGVDRELLEALGYVER